MDNRSAICNALMHLELAHEELGKCETSTPRKEAYSALEKAHNICAKLLIKKFEEMPV